MVRPPWLYLAPVLPALLVSLGGDAHARPKWSLVAEAGPEIDSNVLRTATVTDAQPTVFSPLLRLFANGSFVLPIGSRLQLGLSYGGGGKVFSAAEARAADELVQLADASAAILAAKGAVLLLTGSYYDAFQRESQRDFRTGAGSARLLLDHPSRLRATLITGYRGLEYKPSSDYSFNGPTAGLLLTKRLTSGRGEATVDWNVGLSYSFGYRRYSGLALGLRERCSAAESALLCSYPKDIGRSDLNHGAQVEVNYLGAADATLAYSVEANGSNSYGETFVRHAITMKFTTELLYGVTLTGKGVIQLSRFKDPFLLSQTSSQSFISIDDENRSSLLVQLSRDLFERFTLTLRYVLYVNEAAASSDPKSGAREPAFRRHTLFLGARFEYGTGG